ncbi:ATP-binding cassette sub- A member 2 [Podila verticillata]|nr:ATP-binding cassette sub- A member 2 [Podila verticillata]
MDHKGETHGLPTASRLTAQMSYNVVSQPTASQQFFALLIKNIRIRTRDLAQTLNALFQPVWMMLILVFLHLSAKSASNHMDVKALPFLSVDTCKSATSCTYFGYTGVPATDPIITEISGFLAASEPNTVVPKFYANEEAMQAAYDASPVNFVVGIVFLGPSTNLSKPTNPAAPDQFQYTILANHTAWVFEEYLDSRFATAQAYVERAAINLRRKANGKPPLSSPLPLKTDPGTATTGAGRTFLSYANFVGLGSSINGALNPYYVIFCYQAVWLGVLSIIVEEKKKKIRMAMSMMGMTQNAYLFSLWLMQNIQNLAICALMTFILFIGRIFVHSNAFIVWLVLVLFSFNATAIGTMASVIVPDPKKTNQVSFILLIIMVGAYGACAALAFGGSHIVTTTQETLLFLIPSVALGRSIQYVTGVEAALGGVTFENISEGPVGRAIWIRENADMFENFDLSRVPVEDRKIIQVKGMRKSYSTSIGWAYHVPLWGLFIRMFYPPNSSRKTGPFAGAQEQEVVAGLDLEVHRNEILGFLVHNGAGKTTSLSIIMGMVKPTTGTVIVNGHLLPDSEGVTHRDLDMRTLGEVQKQMGVCPQHDVLFETLTAWETVQLYAAIKGVKVTGRKNVYLKEKKHERVSTFSGGMKRKLSVALAFLGDPKVVLLDEPTTGMDVFTRKQVWQLMQDSKAGRAILLTTHSMEEADALGDRIAILSHGHLQTLGSSLFLKNRFGLGYRLSLEKRRVMLADQHKQVAHVGDEEIVLFDEARTTAIVNQYFPDATIEVNTATDIIYVLPTTGSVEQLQGRSAQEYIQDRKAVLPALFAHLDQEIAANRLGVKSVGLALTTLEEVFVSLQEQEEQEKLAKEELDKNAAKK